MSASQFFAISVHGVFATANASRVKRKKTSHVIIDNLLAQYSENGGKERE